MVRALFEWLETLDPSEGYKWATTLHRIYWDTGYRLASLRARFAADAFHESGESIRSYAPKLGISEVRLRQLIRDSEGRHRAPRQPKRKRPEPEPEPSPPRAPARKKRRPPGPFDATVPLPMQLRTRLEQMTKNTGHSAESLMLVAITSLLDQLENSAGSPATSPEEGETSPPG
jgi:hypothetical protein